MNRLTIILLLIGITQLSQTNAQYITIDRQYGDYLGWDFIHLTTEGKFYFTDAKDGETRMKRPPDIGLYKYKTFEEFILKHVTIENIEQLKEDISKIEEPSIPCTEKHDPWMNIEFRYKDTTIQFGFTGIRDYRLYASIEHAYILQQINLFFDAFYEEHGCPKGEFYLYALKKGETLKSVSKKLGLEYKYVEECNNALCGGFYLGRAERVFMGELKKREPRAGDRILLPCFCVKQDKYEDVLPIR